MSNRISLSILFALIAMLMAFYSGLVYSQSVGNAPLAASSGGKLSQRSSTTLLVSANVQASCRFQTASGVQAGSLASAVAAAMANFGTRCSLAQPVVLSFNQQALSSLAQVVVLPNSGHHTTQSYGTPFWAEATDQGLLVSF